MPWYATTRQTCRPKPNTRKPGSIIVGGIKQDWISASFDQVLYNCKAITLSSRSYLPRFTRPLA